MRCFRHSPLRGCRLSIQDSRADNRASSNGSSRVGVGRTCAMYRGTESCASRLGRLLPDGECRPGVQQAGWLRVPAAGPFAVSTGRTTGDAAEGLDQQTALGNGSASAARHSVIQPYAGNQNAVKPRRGRTFAGDRIYIAYIRTPVFEAAHRRKWRRSGRGPRQG
jgi:hypothetical protein